jgi:hypothetical protein
MDVDSTRSLWATVAHRYASKTELRAGGLGARFWVEFRDGVLVLSMPNGVERRIDREELRATLRQQSVDPTPEIVRLVSMNGPFIAAIGDDLGASGYDPGSLLSGDPDDVGPIEAALLEEARTRSRDSVGSAPSPPKDDAEALRAELEDERAEKEELIRLQARHLAAIASLGSQVRELEARATQLDDALRRAKEAKPVQPTMVGTAVDYGVLLTLARREVEIDSLPAPTRKAIVDAAKLASSDPGLAVVKCRLVLEELTRAEWRKAFRADDLPAFANFTSLMEDLRDQPGVDRTLWNVRRTLFTVANSGAHELGTVSSRRAALVVLVTAAIAARTAG